MLKFIILFGCCFIGNNFAYTDMKINNEYGYSVDTLLNLKFGKSDSSSSLLHNADEFPIDFAFDNSLNLYLLEFNRNNIRKLDSTGKNLWEHDNSGFLYSSVYYMDNKIYQTDGKNLSILNAEGGKPINFISLPKMKKPIFPGDNTFFYGSALYIKYLCPAVNFLNAHSILIFDLINLKKIKEIECKKNEKNGSSNKLWFCDDFCESFEYIGHIDPDALLGRSSKYLIFALNETDSNATGEFTRIAIFNIVNKTFKYTDLAKYHCEPNNSKQFKFIDDNTAVVQAVEYNGGLPYCAHYLRIAFRD